MMIKNIPTILGISTSYRIRGVIGKSNMWRFALKCSWQDFYLAILSTVWKETHAYSLNGVHLIWRYYVIHQTTKYTYMVYLVHENTLTIQQPHQSDIRFWKTDRNVTLGIYIPVHYSNIYNSHTHTLPVHCCITRLS